MSRSNRKASPPPYLWKVPAPEREKDYMSENYRRMKSIAADGQRKLHGPLKAQFVPGVTKNSRYAHVQSKVGAILKGQNGPQKSFSDELANRRLNHSQKFTVNNPNNRSTPQQFLQNGNGQSRLSRSSVDLRSQSSQSGYARQDIPLRREGEVRQGSISASMSHQPARQSMSHPEIPSASVQIFQPNPPDESIYKWKFNDDPPLVYKNGDNNLASSQYQSLTSLAPSQPSQCHRVEYLPCDGICAEETYVNHSGNPESARSTSSRTSRGCNTEETRIFAETKVQQQIQEQQPLQKPFHCRGLVLGQNGNGASNEDLLSQALNSRGDSGLTQQRRHFPMNGLSNSQGTLHQDQSTQKDKPFKNERNFYPFNGGAGDLEVQMKNMSVRDSGRQEVNKTNNSNNKQQKVSQGGDFHHVPGTVPKYLKQRQETWRIEEAAKKEAESTAHIPSGYVLMSEDERLDNLKQFRKSYEMLIAELNRVPITIDTMRVRNHKVDLERQLTRLEEAMKTFSRPKVWVKVDD